MATDEQNLSEARNQWQLSEEADRHNREAAIEDLRFSALSQQWKESAKAQREKEGRPALTINQIEPIIQQIVNECRKNKPSIKFHPVDDGADQQTAEIYNGLVRTIQNGSNADIAYDTAVEHSVRCGTGYWVVDIRESDDDSWDKDAAIRTITNPFAIYRDPHSVETDGSDWNFAFITDRIAKKQFERKWKGAEPVDWDSAGYGDIKEPWVETDELLIAEWWTRDEVYKTIVQLSDGTIIDKQLYIENKRIFDAIQMSVTRERQVKSYRVRQRIITGAEILEENDFPGKYIPIVPVVGKEIWVDGKRWTRGVTRDLIDSQQSYNVARSQTMEVLLQAPKTPYIGPVGAFNTDRQKWRTINRNAYPNVEYDVIPGAPNGGMPMRQEYAGPPAGLIQEAMQASSDIKTVSGRYNASLGDQREDIQQQSGRAILALQASGDSSVFNYTDNVTRAIRHTGRILLGVIPHVYSGERIIRIIGNNPKESQVVNLGKPITLPSGEQKIIDLSVGKYDLTVEAGPNYATKRDEAAQQMLKLIEMYPAAAPIISPFMVRNLDWHDSDEIAQALKALLPPQVQGANPQLQMAQQQIQQLNMQLQQAKQAVTALKMDKQIEGDDLRIKAYSAETDRLKVQQEAMSPQDIIALVHQTLRDLLTTPSPNPGNPQQFAAPPGIVPGTVPNDSINTNLSPISHMVSTGA